MEIEYNLDSEEQQPSSSLETIAVLTPEMILSEAPGFVAEDSWGNYSDFSNFSNWSNWPNK